jgi:hypothetical protein
MLLIASIIAVVSFRRPVEERPRTMDPARE